MAVPREHPYIWVAWLPKLMTGENFCEWAVWFKAHYRDWTRPPSNFDQAQWLLDHTALLNEQQTEWEDRDHDVAVERCDECPRRGAGIVSWDAECSEPEFQKGIRNEAWEVVVPELVSELDR